MLFCGAMLGFFFSVSEAWKKSCLSILCEIFVMPHSFSMCYVRMSWILFVCACMSMYGSVCMYRDAVVYMWRSEDSLGCWFSPSTLFETPLKLFVPRDKRIPRSSWTSYPVIHSIKQEEVLLLSLLTLNPTPHMSLCAHIYTFSVC